MVAALYAGAEGPTAPQSGTAEFAGTVKRGALWSAGGTIVLRISNIALMAIVARIVAPEELGIFALAVTVHALVSSVAELGVASAIARSDLDIAKIAPTVITLSVAGSTALALIMFGFAGTIADALGSPAGTTAIQIMSIGVFLIGPFAVPGAVLQRDFRQDIVFRASAISFIPASLVLFVLATLGNGPEAFAWSRVIGQVVMGTIMIMGASKNFWPGFRREFVRPLLKFGLPLALANLLSQLLLNADYIFVGRMLGVEYLGIYMLAFGVSTWSTAVIGSMLNGVVLPAYSGVLRDKGDASAAVAGAVRIVAWIAAPIAAFTFAFSTPLITTIYGQKWSHAGPVLGVLSFYGVIAIFGLLFANIIIATGHTGVLFGVQIAALLVLMPALPIGIANGGLLGAGVAHIVVVSCVTLPVYLLAVRKTTGTRIRRILGAMMWPAAAATIAAGAAWAVTLPLESPWMKVLVGGIIGALAYGIMTKPQLETLFPRLLRRRSSDVDEPRRIL